MEPIDRELFEILACPKCKANLKYNDNKTALICTKCKKEYLIRETIPVLLSEDE